MLLRLALIIFGAILLLRVVMTACIEAKAGITTPRLAVLAEPALPVAAAVLTLLAGVQVIGPDRYLLLAVGLLLTADGVARWGIARTRRRR